MNRLLMPALMCAWSAPALAQQPMAPPPGMAPSIQMERKAELRKDVMRVRAEAANAPPATFKEPAPSGLSPGEREQLRQFLRQQQIENIRPRP